ncbi:MAG: hypothetical protein C4326_10975 [Ignavibacteria bacterium]
MREESNVLSKVLLVSTLCAVLMLGCSETITNPTTPGSGLLSRELVIRDTTLVAVYDSVFQLRIPPDSLLFAPTQRNLIGKNGNYTAMAALRFFPPVRDTISVLSAKLTLRFIARYGEASGTFGFTIHKILSEWNQRTLTWPLASAPTFYEASVVRSSYTSTTNPDTQLVTLDLDTALVREWYRSGQTSYGVLLVPQGTSNVLRGFSAFDFDSTKFWPKLEVIATDPQRTGRFTDTTTFQAGADTYVADVSPFTIDPQHIYTQAGIVYRSVIKFDASKLPRGAIVNSAELHLERDPAMSVLFGFSPDPTPVVHALTRADSVVFEIPFSTGALKGGSTTTFAFDIRRQAQLWVNGINNGLLLRQSLANEVNTLDLFAFYGSRAADPAKRPRVLIRYSVFQN